MYVYKKNPRDSNVPYQNITLSIVGNSLAMFCLTPEAFSLGNHAHVSFP